MKRIAIPKMKITESAQLYCDCFGVTVFMKLDPSQKWTITNKDKRYFVLAKKGQVIRLTHAAFNRLFEEVVNDDS